MGHFNKQYDSQVAVVLTECTFVTIDQKRRFNIARAMGDTGSTATIISRRIAAELQLDAFQQGGVSGIGGDAEGNTYLLHVMLPSGDVVTYQEVYEADLGDYDAIIGMDIIGMGNFHVDSIGGKTSFYFELPSK